DMWGNRFPLGAGERARSAEGRGVPFESGRGSQYGEFGRNGLPAVSKTVAPSGWGFDSSALRQTALKLLSFIWASVLSPRIGRRWGRSVPVRGMVTGSFRPQAVP